MDETLRDRITRERNERKVVSDLQEFARKSTDLNNGLGASRISSTDRRQEVETRVRELNAPPPPPAPVRKGIEAVRENAVTSDLHPFKFASEIDGATLKWKVLSNYSSITDGTNGSALSISGLDTLRTTNGYIYVQCTINSALEVTGTTIVVESAAIDEVVIPTTEQTQANLLIGRVIYEDSTYKFIQAIREAQLLTHGLVNAAAVRVFQAHPVHPSILVLP